MRFSRKAFAAARKSASGNRLVRAGSEDDVRGSQFTCFTGTRVQILTPGELRVRSALEKASKQVAEEIEVLALLALLVQKKSTEC